MSDALRREKHGQGLTESEPAPTAWGQVRGWVDDASAWRVERRQP